MSIFNSSSRGRFLKVLLLIGGVCIAGNVQNLEAAAVLAHQPCPNGGPSSKWWHQAGLGTMAECADESAKPCVDTNCPSFCPPCNGGGASSGGGMGRPGKSSCGDHKPGHFIVEKGGGSGGGCGGNGGGEECGMVQWSVRQPFLNILLSDTPFFYQPSKGPAIRFSLNYNSDPGDNLGTDGGQTMLFGVGTNWSTPWRSYVQKSADSSRAFVIGGDGSVRDYQLTCIGIGDCTSTAEYYSQTKLTYHLSPEYFELTNHDGSKRIYNAPHDFDDGVTSQTLWFLSSVVDANGQTIMTFNYESRANDTLPLKLQSIIDVDGNTNIFTYTNKGPYSALISQVSGPFGLTANLSYSSTGFLTNITDTLGLKSGMGYNSSNRIGALATDYGTTVFSNIFPSTAQWYGLLVTEKSVRKHCKRQAGRVFPSVA